jgi:hypothetical protein
MTVRFITRDTEQERPWILSFKGDDALQKRGGNWHLSLL